MTGSTALSRPRGRARTSRGWAGLLAGAGLCLALTIALALGGAGTALSETGASPAAGAPEGGTAADDLVVIPLSPTGERELIPIAIPNIRNIGDSDPSGIEAAVNERLRSAMGLAGFFRVLGPERFFFDPATDGMRASQIDFQRWYDVGARGLIQTAFRVATHQARLDFRLYNVDTGQELDIGWEARTVPLDEVIPELYEFINRVIEYYTGAPGVFGSRIAYVAPGSGRTKQIYTMYSDGSGVSSVTSNRVINILPSWGPGGQVMYTSYLNYNPDLYLGPNNQTRLSSRRGLNVGGRLSPDGRTIALTMSRDDQAEIYAMDADGSNLRRLTSHPAEDVSPSWSPDGRRLAFVSDRTGGPQIYVMNADGSGQRRITFAGRYNTTPAWSPDGSRIAFTGRDSRNRFDIFTVDPETSYIERLTQDQGHSQSPTWSPDGRWIAFTSTRDGGPPRLYVMTADGNFQRVINPDVTGVESPAWGPMPSRSRQ